MPRKSRLPYMVLLADTLAGILASAIPWFLLRTYPAIAIHNQTSLSTYDFCFYGAYVVFTLTAIALGGDYVSRKRYSRLQDISLVLKNAFISFGMLICSAFVLEDFVLTEMNELSRPGILIMVAAFVTLLLLIRMAAHHAQIRAFDNGAWRKKMLIIGAGPQGLKVYNHLNAKNWLGVKCVGFVDEKASSTPVEGVPLLGGIDDLQRVVAEQQVEEVVIALPPEDRQLMERIVNNGVRSTVKVRIIPDSFAYPYSKLDIQEYDGLAMIDVKQPNLSAMHNGLKRMIDVSLALFLLLVDLPLMIPIVVMVRISSKGPVLYRQTRLGKDGEPFQMLKFRSMFVGAHEMMQDLKRRNEASGAMFKMKNDPRITRFGGFIRRTSLDELPQLINVLKGDMSMVGPRPPLPDEVGHYQAHHLKRLAVRPGLTGLWQVSGRDRRDFEEMARLDLYYIENWSIRLDLKIILKTVPVVLSRQGAI